MDRMKYRVRIDNGAQGNASRFLGCMRAAEGLRQVPAPVAYCYNNVGDALAAAEGQSGRNARVANLSGTYYGYVIERVPLSGENPGRTQPMLTVPLQVDPTEERRRIAADVKAESGECGHDGCSRPGAGAAGLCAMHHALADLIEAAHALVAQTRGRGYTGTDDLEAAIAAFENEADPRQPGPPGPVEHHCPICAPFRGACHHAEARS